MIKNHVEIQEEITRTSIQLLLKEPFYSHVFSCLNKLVVEANHELKTMAVGIVNNAHLLYVNEQFWCETLIEPSLRYGVLKHEILHIILKHTLVREPKKDQHLVNIAMDIVVNQYILREQLPENGVFLETFPDLNLEKEKSWQYYYDRLKHLSDNIDTEFKNTVSAENFKAIPKDEFGLERHQLWDSEMTENDKALQESIIDNIIRIAHDKTSSKFWGTVSGNFKMYIDSIIHKAKPDIHWRRMIKLFGASSNKTRIKNTIKKVSKRYGTVPGLKIKKMSKLLVAIDTSGSVDKSNIQLFFSEIFHLWRNGAEIWVSECDSDIKRTYEYKGKLPRFVEGRGGTSFDAPIQYANEQLNPDGIIYFTDGYAPAPQIRSRCQLLWIITPDGIALEHEELKTFPGRKAKLKP